MDLTAETVLLRSFHARLSGLPTVMTQSGTSKSIIVFGASGSIGQATVKALLAEGHDVTAILRKNGEHGSATTQFEGAVIRYSDVTDPGSIAGEAFAGDAFDVVISCLASRTGEPKDAWRIDHQANSGILKTAKAHGVSHMILLSAICVQKPRLAFQHAKLAFEKELVADGLTYSIVRPTAFFKSLSGQIERVRKGKPFLVFGDGTLTSCKPISDGDLARYIAGCIDLSERHNAVLPIGGPGPAITPKEQGQMLFELTGKEPRFRKVPILLLNTIVAILSLAGRISRRAAAKAEYAKIGRYYATESMLVFDPLTQKYSAEATPETGSETLFEHYASKLRQS